MSFLDLEQYQDAPLAIDKAGTVLSYRQAAAACDEFSKHFECEQKGIVAIECSNTLEAVIGYLAAIRSGQVALLLNQATKDEVKREIYAIYEPEYLWKKSEDGFESLYRWGSYGLHSLRPRPKSIHPELSLLLSTSGSTGSPKLVRLSRKNIESNAGSIAEYLGLTRKDKPITTLPMSYSYGLSIMNSHLSVGATLLLTDDSLMTKSFWQFLAEQEATSFGGVPYTYEMLERLRFRQMQQPSLKTLTQAGGKLHPDLARTYAEHCRERGIAFFTMYGQTEATARMAYLSPQHSLEKAGSVGWAIPGGRIDLLDSEDRLIETPDVDGELVYTGSNVMLGYAEKAEDLVLGDQLGGQLRTGDIARRDADGFLYITGRLKRFIKMFGNRVNLDEIDGLLRAQGFNCVCGGMDDALVVANTVPADAARIKEIIVKTYKFNHAFVSVIDVPEIRRTESGKIRYNELFGAATHA